MDVLHYAHGMSIDSCGDLDSSGVDEGLDDFKYRCHVFCALWLDNAGEVVLNPSRRQSCTKELVRAIVILGGLGRVTCHEGRRRTASDRTN